MRFIRIEQGGLGGLTCRLCSLLVRVLISAKQFGGFLSVLLNGVNTMRTLTALTILFFLTGCADMTPREKFWTGVAVGVVATGAVIAYRERHENHPVQQTECRYEGTTSQGVLVYAC